MAVRSPKSFANWAAAVPDGFKFSVKASRFTTNRKVLKDGAASIEKFLTQGLTRLGDRLGPIHWQFMATKKFDRDDFAGFLDLLADRQDGLPLRHAIEVRDESFRDPAFVDMLRERNMGSFMPTATNSRASTNRPPISPTRGSSAARKMSKRAMTIRRSTIGEASPRLGQGRPRRVPLLHFGAKVRNPAAAQALIAKLAD